VTHAAAGAPFGLSEVAFWKAYWRTTRPYLGPVSGASGLVGLALAPSPSSGALWSSLGVFVVAYGLGQALTDVFQTDTDALSAPDRPLVAGTVGKAEVTGVSLAGLLACAAVLLVNSPESLALSLLGVAGLASYTYFKRRWWAGPPWNGAIVALLPVLGYLAGGGTFELALREPRLWLATGAIFGSYAVFVLIGYLKDVEADRAAGYTTLPVRFGRRTAVLASACFSLVGVSCSAALVVPLVSPPASTTAVGCLLVWTFGVASSLVAHGRGWFVARDDRAFPAIAWSVRSFVALHLAEATLVEPSFVAALPVGLVAFEILLALRPDKRQI
jgi:geranylgeranylglycerol-phosphate geranylgeranyltransferase